MIKTDYPEYKNKNKTLNKDMNIEHDAIHYYKNIFNKLVKKYDEPKNSLRFLLDYKKKKRLMVSLKNEGW